MVVCNFVLFTYVKQRKLKLVPIRAYSKPHHGFTARGRSCECRSKYSLNEILEGLQPTPKHHEFLQHFYLIQHEAR